MGLFPQQFIDDLKHHADIVAVIQDYVSLKKTGATYKGLCPFHGEKTPSFHVNRDKGFFHCFGCGVGGDVFKFLELHDKVGFQDAVKQLAQDVLQDIFSAITADPFGAPAIPALAATLGLLKVKRTQHMLQHRGQQNPGRCDKSESRKQRLKRTFRRPLETMPPPDQIGWLSKIGHSPQTSGWLLR